MRKTGQSDPVELKMGKGFLKNDKIRGKMDRHPTGLDFLCGLFIGKYKV